LAGVEGGDRLVLKVVEGKGKKLVQVEVGHG
jgi:hypothetical protein